MAAAVASSGVASQLGSAEERKAAGQAAANKSKKQQELETVHEPVVKHVDLLPAHEEIAFTAARMAYLGMTKGELPHWKDVAEYIKKEMDSSAGGTWHCIVGTHFGSFVTFEARSSAYFFLGAMGVLIFKHG